MKLLLAAIPVALFMALGIAYLIWLALVYGLTA